MDTVIHGRSCRLHKTLTPMNHVPTPPELPVIRILSGARRHTYTCQVPVDHPGRPQPIITRITHHRSLNSRYLYTVVIHAPHQPPAPPHPQPSDEEKKEQE